MQTGSSFGQPAGQRSGSTGRATGPDPVATYVYAGDPISQAGVISQLRQRAEIRVVDAEHLGEAVVAVVVADGLTDEVLRVLRALQRGSIPRTVLVARVIDDSTDRKSVV